MEICQKSPSSADNIIEFLADGSWKPSLETSGMYIISVCVCVCVWCVWCVCVCVCVCVVCVLEQL